MHVLECVECDGPWALGAQGVGFRRAAGTTDPAGVARPGMALQPAFEMQLTTVDGVRCPVVIVVVSLLRRSDGGGAHGL